jgi:hypothetical protein
MKAFFQKFLPPVKTQPPPVVEPSSSPSPRSRRPQDPSVVKLPAGLMKELFPERESMISAVFDGPASAAAPRLDAAVRPPELPSSAELLAGTAETPEVLSISDELREAIFPRQKVMVSVMLNLAPQQPLSPEPSTRRGARDDSDTVKDFPII